MLRAVYIVSKGDEEKISRVRSNSINPGAEKGPMEV